jgi:hypothetical protein
MSLMVSMFIYGIWTSDFAWWCFVLAVGGMVVGGFGLAILSGYHGEHGALLHTKEGERWTALEYSEPV